MHVEHVASLVVVLPQGYTVALPAGVMVNDGIVDHLPFIAPSGNPALEVLGVLGPPEEFGHGQAHRLDDLVGHDEAAPGGEQSEGAVGLAGYREDERRLRLLF